MAALSSNPLLKILRPGAGIIIPGAANALTARIIEQSGFQALIVTGAGISNMFLGMPDVGLATVTEFVEHVARIRDVVSIPIIADGDTGFGNAVNVYRTVRDFERAGANAIQLEDQVFPKKCGHFEGKAVIPAREMAKKVEAAAEARRSPEMLILARTDAYAVEGMQAALDRAAMYREAGADLLFVEAPQTREDLARIPSELGGIQICNMVYGGKTPLLSRTELAAMGYAGIQYANAALQASLKAMYDVLGHLNATGSLAGKESALVSFDERQRAVDHARFIEMEKRFSA